VVQTLLHRIGMTYQSWVAATCRWRLRRAMRRGPARNEAGTQRQARAFEERFGYVR
jgi:hypothetical protein